MNDLQKDRIVFRQVLESMTRCSPWKVIADLHETSLTSLFKYLTKEYMVEYPILKLNTTYSNIIEDVYSRQFRNVVFPKYHFTIAHSQELIEWLFYNCSTCSWIFTRDDKLRVYIEDIKEAVWFKMFWSD